MKRLLLCAVLVVGMAGPAGASVVTGNKLLTNCQSDRGRLFCLGYMLEVADALDAAPVQGFSACKPKGITGQQVYDIVVASLEAIPQHRHLTASRLVAGALSEAFPCKK